MRWRVNLCNSFGSDDGLFARQTFDRERAIEARKDILAYQVSWPEIEKEALYILFKKGCNLGQILDELDELKSFMGFSHPAGHMLEKRLCN